MEETRSLLKKIKTSLEIDDFGFGSRLIPIKDVLEREIKISLCPVEGVIYYY